MRTDDLFEVILSGEGQTAEFKESLTSNAKREAIQTMVAFANAQGGRVFFGVRNDGRAKGVQLGGDTQERLAKLVRDHTYPSVPFVIDDPFIYEGKTVLSVEVSRDVPPVIGVYVYRPKAIPPDKPVDTSEMQAYRRVGRTNQKEDFMRLRQPQPSDPKVRIRVAWSRAGYYLDNRSLSNLDCSLWAEEGSATAHALRLYLNPGLFVSEEMVEDLPRPGGEGFVGVERLDIRSVPATKLLEATEISSIYLDDWGISWKVSRGIRMTAGEDERHRWIDVEDRGLFTRRIIAFPPKRE